MTDLRWLTGLCDGVIGVALICVSLWVWFMPLYRRAVMFEPYFTPEGARWLLRVWPLMFIIGAFMLVSAAARLAYYLHGNPVMDGFVLSIGAFEAVFSLWAAGSVTVVTVRLWRAR